MRKILYVLVLAVLMAPVLPGEAQAQFRPWEISIGLGPSFPTGDLADFADTGYHVQGSVGFDAPLLPVGLRLDLLWQELPDTPEDSDEWYRQIGGLANAVFEIPLIIIQPYALAGVGVMNSSRTGMDDDSETLVGFNAGAGLEFPFVGLGGFIEARYLNIFGGGDASSRQTIPVTVGIRF